MFALLLILVYGSFLISNGLYNIGIDFIDLPSFYQAARVTFHLGESPYDVSVLTQEHAAPEDRTVFPFLHPPPSLLLFYPLSLVSYRAAGTITLAINHILVLVFLALFLRGILRQRSDQSFATLAAVYVLLFHPLAMMLGRGQINLLVINLICVAWLFSKRKSHPSFVALPLSVAILGKGYPALFIGYFLVKRQWRIVSWIVASLLVITTAAYLVLPGIVWNDWIRDVLPHSGYGKTPPGLFSPAGPWNQSINGFVARIFLTNEFSDAILPSPLAGSILPVLLCALVVVIALGVCYRATTNGASASVVDGEFGLMLLTVFLVSPFAWEHHLVLVLPSAIMALMHLVDDGVWTIRRGLVAGALLILAWKLPAWAEALKHGVFVLGISTKFYAAVCLWVFFVALVASRTTEPPKHVHERPL
jgi:hypothetical protein